MQSEPKINLISDLASDGKSLLKMVKPTLSIPFFFTITTLWNTIGFAKVTVGVVGSPCQTRLFV